MPALGAAMAQRYRRVATLWVLFPALAAMAVFVVLFQVAGRMVTDGGASFIAVEKAFTPERFAAAVGGWGAGVEAFKWSLITLDFAFPLVYAAALGSLIALAGGEDPCRRTRGLFTFPWVAAGLDWLENLGQLWLLRDVHTAADAAGATYSAPLVAAASAAAMLKFTLLLTAAAGAVILGVRHRVRWAAVVGALLFAVFTLALTA